MVCGDDPAARETFKDFGKRILYYGFGAANDLRIEGEKGHYRVFRDGTELGEFKLQLPGRHNALNAAAALAAGLEAGLSFKTCADGLAAFVGVDRRFQFKGSRDGVDVYDDYGHHPTEVQAVVAAFKEKFPERRLVTVFQPHRYSRTLLCWDQFLTCFKGVDRLFVCDVYAAGEDPITGIDSRRLVQEIDVKLERSVKLDHLPNGDDPMSVIRPEIKSGDILLTLGAGDVYKIGMQFLESGDER